MMYTDAWLEKIDRGIIPYVEIEGFDRCPTYNYYRMGPLTAAALRDVSKKLFDIFCKVVKIFQNCPEEFMVKMDIPEKIIPYLNIPNILDLPTWISRFDFVMDKNNHCFKMVEINADTPCAIPEAFYGNGIAADYLDKYDVNFGEYKKLVDFMSKIDMSTFKPKVNLFTRNIQTDVFAFACFDDYVEDKGNTMFMMNTLRDNKTLSSSRFWSFYDIKVEENHGIKCYDEYARALYRLHPMELLIDEVSTTGEDLGILFLEEYKKNNFIMMNPPESLIMQSKAFQALVWALAESGEYFTEEEQIIIKQHMVPTYFEEDIKVNGFPHNSKRIVKPIWGREGHGVYIVNEDGKTIIDNAAYDAPDTIQRKSNADIHQVFIESDKVEAVTDSGLVEGYMTFSCFMLGNEPSALFARLSPFQVAGIEAYWMPLLA